MVDVRIHSMAWKHFENTQELYALLMDSLWPSEVDALGTGMFQMNDGTPNPLVIKVVEFLPC